MSVKLLEFEKPLKDLYDKIDQLKELSKDGKMDLDSEIKSIENRAVKLKKDIYSNLSPHQVVQIARHINRPDSTSLIRLICDKFIPLHGDRLFRDDPSIVGGLGVIGMQRVMFIGHQKGHDTKENIFRNFGMPHPEGYRKALRLMKMAEKFSIPIVTFIDTPGAFPGIEAEERGQAEAIARNLREMVKITVPILTFVIGEGGSGGALAIGVSNKVFMMEYSVYSVISPEGCASILFRDAKQSEKATKNLKITAKDVVDLGVADEVIKEPLGGAHYNWEETSVSIKKTILANMKQFLKLSTDEIVEQRHHKFRQMGSFVSEKK
ncbi:acetyl-CoA carboxylase carboxyl transferase subunit alpha [Candidatus Marinamargulisbacteria bacterium SCGC AG-343-D04]|nr:acetyl-CoA carboxylase carboxyl transferase subunit alpha [Candidatus Marinamargulisbacteria bacterium SCGC AG-343-D04]